MEKIRIGIVGYGNVGRGVEAAITQNPDMELAGVFTRRDPKSLTIKTKEAGVYRIEEAEKMKDQIDGPTKHQRVKALMDLSHQLQHEFALSQIGKTLEVLIEEPDGESMIGHASNYLKVKTNCWKHNGWNNAPGLILKCLKRPDIAKALKTTRAT